MEKLGLTAVLASISLVPHMSMPFLTLLASWALPRNTRGLFSHW